MSENLNATPSANRIHIGLYGRRNAGKSSLINALTGQNLSIVSEQPGTTTDPVFKAMELLPLGPVVLMDTAGLDDEGALGEQRVQKSLNTLDKADIALLVLEGEVALGDAERRLLDAFVDKKIAHLVVRNKADLVTARTSPADNELWVSAATGENIDVLKRRLAGLVPENAPTVPIIADLLTLGDLVVLVVPIDSAAPKGRLILPQQQTIRDILDTGAQAIVTQPEGLAQTLSKLKVKPRLVVTDSQAFGPVAAVTPPDIPLTSFSILFARHKGILRQTAAGVETIDALRDGDAVLISEGCTHHRQCDDIGSVKLPNMLRKHTGRALNFLFSSGGDFPDDLSGVRLVVHCGGCMLPSRAFQSRLHAATSRQVPMTNFGMAIAHMQGILPRSLEPLRAWLESGK